MDSIDPTLLLFLNKKDRLGDGPLKFIDEPFILEEGKVSSLDVT